MSSSVYIDDNKKYVLILGKGATQALNDTTLTAEAQSSVNFSRSNRKFCLSLHYNWSNSFLFVNATKLYQIKAKDSLHEKCLYLELFWSAFSRKIYVKIWSRITPNMELFTL